MGPHRRLDAGWRSQLSLVAQVVPDIPTFAVDDGFAYLVPGDLSGVQVGSLVRVPLGGRRVRGFVTAVGERDPGRALRPITSRSGAFPVFDEPELRTARWAAVHYVAPLSVILAACAPPNLSRQVAHPALPAVADTTRPRRGRPRFVVAGHDHAAAVISAAEPVLDGGRNVLVVVPTATECEMLLEPLREHFGSRVLAVTSGLGAAEVTRAWSLLAGYGGFLAVGTRELAMWPAGDIGLAVVIEEGRPAMKAKQTPTLHVRDVLRRRSAVERFDLLFRGPVPTLEILAAGVDVAAPSGRVWPLVEIVDRTRESPGSGVVGEGARAAVTAVAARRGTVFVLVPRRGYAGAFACVQCGDIRRCPNCGAAAGRTAACERCGEPLPAACKCGGTRFRPLGAGVGRVIDELRRSVGDSVGEVGSGSPAVVGTERDLVGVVDRDLAVAIDLDGRVLAPNYRAAEDALRLGARLAATVGSGGGRRCLIQTSIPDHPVMTALRTGRPMPFLGDELAAREKASLPPVGELIAIEVRGDHAEAADRVIRSAAADVAVRGPAVTGEEARWLLQGSDLRKTRVRLRNTVQTLRDGGLAVRVDADPVDL